jgi:hypothetical protein
MAVVTAEGIMHDRNCEHVDKQMQRCARYYVRTNDIAHTLKKQNSLKNHMDEI